MFLNLIMFGGVYEMRKEFDKKPQSGNEDSCYPSNFDNDADRTEFEVTKASISNDINTESMGFVRTISIS